MSLDKVSLRRSLPRKEPAARRPRASTMLCPFTLNKYASQDKVSSIESSPTKSQTKSPTKSIKQNFKKVVGFCSYQMRVARKVKTTKHVHKTHILSPEKYIFVTKAKSITS